MSQRALIVLPSIHDVMAAEKLLDAVGLPYDLIPTPTSISSDCGMVIECEQRYLNKIKAELEAAACPIDKIVLLEVADG
jgi:hypothetical protein